MVSRMMSMLKMKHREKTAMHHCRGEEPEYWPVSRDVKMRQARNVSNIFMMPGSVERKPMCSPLGRRRVNTTSPTYTANETQDTTDAPI